MEVKLISYTPNPLLTIASAAAITRGKTIDQIRTDRKYLEKLVKQCYDSGHWSVFEFADFDFEVTGVSRVFEAQAIRSRLASFEWESGRRDQEYEVADEILFDPELVYLAERAIKGYEMAVKLDSFTPELARYVAPQGVARKARIKRNFRNLLETAEIRLCSKAQHEYRFFMQECKRLVTQVDPFLGELLQPKCVRLMYCNEYDSCRYNGALTKAEVKELIDKHKKEG